jgi:hypothetical protein
MMSGRFPHLGLGVLLVGLAVTLGGCRRDVPPPPPPPLPAFPTNPAHLPSPIGWDQSAAALTAGGFGNVPPASNRLMNLLDS